MHVQQTDRRVLFFILVKDKRDANTQRNEL